MFLGPRPGVRSGLQWLAQASSNVCGRSRSEGVLDLEDSVRSRTASVEWNVPGKCGPHGELFFFLIKKGAGDDAG